MNTAICKNSSNCILRICVLCLCIVLPKFKRGGGKEQDPQIPFCKKLFPSPQKYFGFNAVFPLAATSTVVASEEMVPRQKKKKTKKSERFEGFEEQRIPVSRANFSRELMSQKHSQGRSICSVISYLKWPPLAGVGALTRAQLHTGNRFQNFTFPSEKHTFLSWITVMLHSSPWDFHVEPNRMSLPTSYRKIKSFCLFVLFCKQRR